jgi:DNA-binding transcriptional MerR regulator
MVRPGPGRFCASSDVVVMAPRCRSDEHQRSLWALWPAPDNESYCNTLDGRDLIFSPRLSLLANLLADISMPRVVYTPEHLARLEKIRKLQEEGRMLAEIAPRCERRRAGATGRFAYPLLAARDCAGHHGPGTGPRESLAEETRFALRLMTGRTIPETHTPALPVRRPAAPASRSHSLRHPANRRRLKVKPQLGESLGPGPGVQSLVAPPPAMSPPVKP